MTSNTVTRHLLTKFVCRLTLAGLPPRAQHPKVRGRAPVDEI
jgi:hypothetical protein